MRKCIYIGDDDYLLLKQRQGNDSVYVGRGKCGSDVFDLVINTMSLSDIAIPDQSMLVRDSLGNTEGGIVYFLNDRIFYIALRGFSQKLILYQVDWDTRSVTEKARTFNGDFYIDEKRRLLAASSGKTEAERHSAWFWRFQVDVYALNTMHLQASYPYEFSQDTDWDPFDSNLLLMVDTLSRR